MLAIVAGRALAEAHGSGFDLGYTSQAGRQAVGREARDLEVVSSSGGSKLWR